MSRAAIFGWRCLAFLAGAAIAALACIPARGYAAASQSAAPAASAGVPAQAMAYRLVLRRQAQQHWGLGAPVALFAAQIHQESRWMPQARSPVGARGLAQFMPATERWMGQVHAGLRSGDALNPAWSIRAMLVYDRWLADRVRARDACERAAMMLSAYNGGLGWVYKDQKLAAGRGLDAQRWWDSVERVNSGRSAANFQENRGYPRLIIYRHQPLYASWGAGVCS